MTGAPTLDARTGVLSLAEPTFEALAAHASGERGNPDIGEQLAMLRSADVLDEQGRPHPSLGPTLEAIAAPVHATVELSYKRKSMRGWLGRENAALLRPAGENGQCVLMSVALPMVPEALARLVDLTPRPRPEPAAPVPYHDGALQDVRRHWRLTADWRTERGIPGQATLEVVDTDGGMWVLRAETGGEMVAWPSTPTRVWRSIVRVVLRRTV